MKTDNYDCWDASLLSFATHLWNCCLFQLPAISGCGRYQYLLLSFFLCFLSLVISLFFASFFAPSLDGTMCTFPSHVCSVYVRAYTEMFTSHTRTHSLLISNTAHAITCCCSHNNTNTSRNAYGLSFHRSFSKQEKSKQRYDAMATAVAATL